VGFVEANVARNTLQGSGFFCPTHKYIFYVGGSDHSWKPQDQDNDPAAMQMRGRS
jgi:hypothetical protein